MSKPPLLRGSRHFALRCSDRLGRADGSSPGDRRRHGLDAGFGGRCGPLLCKLPGLGRPGDRDHIEETAALTANITGNDCPCPVDRREAPLIAA